MNNNNLASGLQSGLRIFSFFWEHLFGAAARESEPGAKEQSKRGWEYFFY